MPSARSVVALTAFGVAVLVAHFGFFFYRDNFLTHFPVKAIAAQVLRAGEIPYWNFHDSGGQPLAGNPNLQTFYPDTLLHLVLPAHVAFNLHFLIHFAAGIAIVRALALAHGVSSRSAAVAATTYALSGIVISSFASCFAIAMTALVPLAFLAVERRSAPLLGVACGLIGLIGEPTITLGLTLALAILVSGRMSVARIGAAAAIAFVIALPQLIAYSEIAHEVERSVGYPASIVLNTSLTWSRIAEIFFWPGDGDYRGRFFATLFVGLIALPALVRRSRYTLVVLVILFLAFGRNNALVAALVESLPDTARMARFPEKLALVMLPALAVLIAEFLDRARHRRIWTVVTILPLLLVAARTLRIDWYAPYRLAQQPPVRRYVRTPAMPTMPARERYRIRAHRYEPLFGAVAGVRYAFFASPDNMHSLLTRLARERFNAAPPLLKERYLRIAGCDIADALPPAMIAPAVARAGRWQDAVRILEHPRFDEQRMAVAPRQLLSDGRVTHYAERGQTIVVDIAASRPSLLLINQSYFQAWVARTTAGELETLPANIDRLGVIVPPGQHRVTLRFGRRRVQVALAWIASLLCFGGALLVEKLDRRARKIERAGDDDRGLGRVQCGA